MNIDRIKKLRDQLKWCLDQARIIGMDEALRPILAAYSIACTEYCELAESKYQNKPTVDAMDNLPKLGSIWVNRGTQQIYRVIQVANAHKADHDRLPVWVSLTTGGGNIEAREISDFLDNFSEAIGD